MIRERLLDVGTVSKRLGVSPGAVRKLLQSGRIAARKLGNVWTVSENDLREYQGRRRPAHRPWDQASAWDVLCLASGMSREMTAVRLHKARRRLEGGLPCLAQQLGVRARRELAVTTREEAVKLMDHPLVVRTGVSGSRELIAVEEAEVYVRESDLQRIRSAVFMVDPSVSPEYPNVLLRIIPDSEWPFPEGMRTAPDPVVAVDLIDNDDLTGRAGTAGNNLLTKMQGGPS